MNKKALFVATVSGFLDSFEISDISLLQSLGYQVHCACNLRGETSDSDQARLRGTGAVLHQIDFTRSPLSAANRGAYRQLKRLMAEESFDLVHCHTPVGGMLGRLAARKAHVSQVLYTAHGFHFFHGAPLKNWLLFYPLEQMMSRCTDLLITINSEDEHLARKRSHAKRVERIHGVGLDIRRFAECRADREKKRAELGIGREEILLLSVGELDEVKNHITVLRAMETLAPKGFRYLIAGDGALMEAHQAFLREHRLDQAVRLLGYRRDIPELLRAADIYVFPSLREGLSVSLMEAVAAGLPVACSPIRGNVDLVLSPQSYFNPRDPAEAASVIERLAALPEPEKRRLTALNAENLKSYDFSQVRREMTAVYRIADEAVQSKKAAKKSVAGKEGSR
ncbi:MAG: glycosyltransferase family 4 protein [Clostridiales bacterium]|nr:glycosyltransferase family 4 protein [Clostridiales bacterium]